MFAIANIIGNVCPYHRGHAALTDHALSVADRVLFHIGSANLWPHPRTIFTPEEREAMIRLNHPAANADHRLIFHYANDTDTDAAWVESIIQASQAYHPHTSGSALVGHEKDASSYYLKMFPAWTYVPTPHPSNISATHIRHAMHTHGPRWLHSQDAQDMLPDATRVWLDGWYTHPHHRIIEHVWRQSTP